MRLLVVDDEIPLATAVARGLRRAGYAVDVCHDGATAVQRLAEVDYDLVCLDRTMPGMDGLDVCRHIRRTAAPGPRVLLLTARDSVEDRVDGLDAGADDYLVKPFAFAELDARIRNLLRRDRPQHDAVLEVGDVRADEARRTAFRGERALELTTKEFALLRYFLLHPGEVLSQERLLDHVWDHAADPFSNTVRVTVGTLRRKLSAGGEPPVIETVVGAGYRMVEP